MLVAKQVLAQSAQAEVTIFDPEGPGSGIAYGTENPGHLLNVPAGRMSALPEDPDHFLNWLNSQTEWRPDGGITGRSFAPRRVYRAYLQSLLDPWPQRLRHVAQAVTAVVPNADGVTVTRTDGQEARFDAAVLATGNGAGPLVEPEELAYWAHPSGFQLPADAPVAILGTGLSMVDSVIALLDAGHIGPITAISRHGLTPRGHARGAHHDSGLALPPDMRLATLVAWFQRIRREGQVDWRQAVELLRPRTQPIWQGFSDTEKRRFLRHARALWDVHRHRLAPEVDDRMQAARDEGRLRVVAGHLLEDRSAQGEVEIRLRGTRRTEIIPARYLIDCRGQAGSGGMAHNPLLAGLVEAGLAQPGFADLGIAVAPDGAVIDGQGRPSARLYAVGPLTIGTFWEIIAIPDIRIQARDLAGVLVA